MDRKHTIRKICVWTAGSVAVLLLLISLLFALLQTGMAKRRIIGWMISTLSAGSSFQVRMGELQGIVPFNVRLDSFTMSDREGEWVRLEGVTLRWSPAALLKRRIHINEFSSAFARLDRIPGSLKEKKEGKEEKRKFPEWPPDLPSFIVERLHIARLELGKSIAGQDAAFLIEGRMHSIDQWETLAASLRLERVDGPKALAVFSSTLKGKPPVLTIHAMAEEAEDGPLSAALGLKSKGDLSIEVAGEGPLSAWEGRLVAKASMLGSIEAGIGLKIMKEELRLTGDGRVSPYSWTALGDEYIVAIDAGYTEKGMLIVHQADFKTHVADLSLTGGFNLRKEEVDADFSLTIKTLSSYLPLSHHNIEGGLTLKGKIAGPVRQPAATLSMQILDAKFSSIHASELQGELRLASLRPLSSAFPGLALTGNGKVRGFTYPYMAALPLEHFSWAIDTEIESIEKIDIRKIACSAEDLSLTFSGRMNPKGFSLNGIAEAVIEDLGRLSGLLGKRLSGSAILRAALDAEDPGRGISARIEGEIRNPGPLPPALDVLLGKRMEYRGIATIQETSHLTISDMIIRTDSAELTGGAFLDLLTNRMRGEFLLRIPTLAVLSVPAGHPVDGALEMDVNMEGALSDLVVQGEATVNQFRAEGIRIPQWQARFRAEGLASRPRGDFRMDFSYAGGAFHAATDFSLESGHLTLSDLFITAPGAEAGGDLALDLQSPILKGSVSGRFDDVSGLSSLFLKEGIAGSGRFNALFLEEGEGQGLVLDCEGDKLRGAFGDAAGIIVYAHLTDLFHAVQGNIGVDAEEFRKGELSIETISVSAEGNAASLLFSGKVLGSYVETFEIQAQGIFTASSEGERVGISVLRGRYGEYPFFLTQPVAARRSGHEYTFEGIDVSMGGGRFAASSRISLEWVTIDTRFYDLPLRMLHMAGYPDLTGSADGTLLLSGRPEHPDASIELSVRDAGLQKAVLKKLMPVTLRTQATFTEGLVQAKASVEGIAENPFEASLRLPLEFSLSPLRLGLPPRGEIQGHVKGEASLAPISGILNLEDQVIEGIANITLSLMGDMREPRLKGIVHISNGVYENTRIGTLIKDIEISIRGDDQGLVVEDARATDGERGAISAKGFINIISAKELHAEANLTLTEFLLLRRHNLNAKADGHLTFTGSQGQAILAGRLKVGPAEFSIPERLPPEVAEIEVIEINHPGEEQKTEPAPSPRMGRAASLDLAVDFPGRIFVRGRGLDSEWKGTLHVGGDTRAPMITGNLSIVRGSFDLFGKRFALAAGDIHFDGSVPSLPTFDVTAENRRKDLTSRIRFSGTPSALSLKLESDPPFPSDEILARVLFGRSVTEVTPLQAVRLAQAVNTLSGRSGGVLDFMGRTRMFIGVDQLGIRQSEEGSGVTSVTVGKYLAEGIYLEMDKGVGTEPSKISVEVDLTPNITIESETGSDSRGGGILNWKWDY